MNILITGKSGSGKSNLGDIVKNFIFKIDKDCHIFNNDIDRNDKEFGRGKNEYNMYVKQIPTKEDVDQADVIINLQTKAFHDWFHKIYSKE